MNSIRDVSKSGKKNNTHRSNLSPGHPRVNKLTPALEIPGILATSACECPTSVTNVPASSRLIEEYSLLRLPERSAAADNPFSLHCRSRDSWASTCLNRIGNARALLSLGLYELFIDDSIALPEWLVMHTPDDLKEKLVGFIVVGLAADFPGHAITWTPPFFRCSRKKPPATKKRDCSLQNNFPVIIRFSPVFSLPVIIRIY